MLVEINGFWETRRLLTSASPCFCLESQLTAELGTAVAGSDGHGVRTESQEAKARRVLPARNHRHTHRGETSEPSCLSLHYLGFPATFHFYLQLLTPSKA